MRNIWLRMRRRLSLCYTYTAFISRFIYILASANLSHHLLAPTKGVKFKSKEGVQAFWNRVWKLTNSSILACILSMFNHNTRGPFFGINVIISQPQNSSTNITRAESLFFDIFQPKWCCGSIHKWRKDLICVGNVSPLGHFSNRDPSWQNFHGTLTKVEHHENKC